MNTEETTTDDQLLTPQEAAEKLRVSTDWLYRAARREEFPCVRMGRLVRFRRSDVLDRIQQGGAES